MARAKRPTEIQTINQNAGTSKIKKKIRDLERLARKPDLHATKKIETERALNALRGDLETAESNNKQRVLAKKYHMVRFFERKKATRRLKQALKKVREVEKDENSGPDDSKLALKEFKKREIDYYYVFTFPMDKKYVALFASEEKTDHHKKYLSEIKQQIKDGLLPSGIKNDKAVALQYQT